ncbi:uncharacterized protein OGAPODRAFT_99352 [Ogataea polymorpha]|uniref:uncharacterized protein n=1 Tax=Ogataea polymorpha TaxID=460523 RepID=UPI0007F530A2|nr:uncharacterized protein OGAPODRAFT_99352 [Ogataea polymorpha]OBA16527.1 hypothetical protein OGAPODRAFT_99352 [Ogataea polymorpha]
MVKSVPVPLVNLDFGTDPLFSFSAHPSKNALVVGSGTGQVKLLKYDVEKLENHIFHSADKGCAQIDVRAKELQGSDCVTIGWRTKRHQGSCRSIIFDTNGEYVYSAGLDKQIKKAKAETGVVVAKSEILASNITKILTVPNKNFLIVGTEDGDVLCLDSNTLKQTYQIKKVHEDAVNSISHYVPKSDYQFVTTGSTTLSHIDIRKDQPLHQSEDQEDELLCSAWLDPTNPNTMLCGMGEGVVTVWRPEMNDFADQISRVRISKEPVESLISALDSEGDHFWVGSFDGTVSRVNIRSGKVVEKRAHSETDEVSYLDLDHEYRLISAGMDRLTIWRETGDVDSSSDEEDEEEIDETAKNSDSDSSSENSDSNDDRPIVPLIEIKEKLLAQLEDSDEEPPKKRKKQMKKETKKQKAHTQEHGIRKFDGL